MAAVSAKDLAVHHDMVRNFVRRMVRDEVLAEDLAQETFLRAQRAAAAYRGSASERTWLCSIAVNVVRDDARSKARRSVATVDPGILETVPGCTDTERELLEAEMSACIGEYLLELPTPYCDVVALHDSAELTHREIAALLDISEANSRVLLHRGRAMLREKLSANCVLSFGAEAIPCERRRSDDES